MVRCNGPLAADSTYGNATRSARPKNDASSSSRHVPVHEPDRVSVHASRDLVQGQGPVLPGLSDHEQLPTPLLGLAQQVEGVDKVLEPLVGRTVPKKRIVIGSASFRQRVGTSCGETMPNLKNPSEPRKLTPGGHLLAVWCHQEPPADAWTRRVKGPCSDRMSRPPGKTHRCRVGRRNP